MNNTINHAAIVELFFSILLTSTEVEVTLEKALEGPLSAMEWSLEIGKAENLLQLRGYNPDQPNIKVLVVEHPGGVVIKGRPHQIGALDAEITGAVKTVLAQLQTGRVRDFMGTNDAVVGMSEIFEHTYFELLAQSRYVYTFNIRSRHYGRPWELHEINGLFELRH